MTSTEEAVFCCIAALAIALEKKGSIDLTEYFVHIATAGDGARERGEHEFADALGQHVRTLLSLREAAGLSSSSPA
jgi:hypothetical protein